MTRRHLRVPGDLAIVGYDDIDFAAAAAVPLTSVAQPRAQLGRAAAELLIEEVESAPSHQHRQVIFDPRTRRPRIHPLGLTQAVGVRQWASGSGRWARAVGAGTHAKIDAGRKGTDSEALPRRTPRRHYGRGWTRAGRCRRGHRSSEHSSSEHSDIKRTQ